MLKLVRTTLTRLLLPALILCLPGLAAADVLDEILERGSIRVGVSLFVPWTIRTDSGELIGYEVDVARKIAADIGVDVELRVYEWEDIVPALEDGEIDMIAAGMAVTPRRALRVDFTNPTAESGVGLATNTAMTADIKSLDELNRKSIVITTVGDTLAHSVAKMMFADADLKVYPGAEPAEKEVLEGRAHAYLASIPEVRFMSLLHGEEIDVPLGEPLVGSSEALAVRRGEQGLLNFLNAWVTARHADKWLDTTRDYWFGTLDWTDRVRD